MCPCASCASRNPIAAAWRASLAGILKIGQVVIEGRADLMSRAAASDYTTMLGPAARRETTAGCAVALARRPLPGATVIELEIRLGPSDLAPIRHQLRSLHRRA